MVRIAGVVNEVKYACVVERHLRLDSSVWNAIKPDAISVPLSPKTPEGRANYKCRLSSGHHWCSPGPFYSSTFQRLPTGLRTYSGGLRPHRLPRNGLGQRRTRYLIHSLAARLNNTPGGYIIPLGGIWNGNAQKVELGRESRNPPIVDLDRTTAICPSMLSRSIPRRKLQTFAGSAGWRDRSAVCRRWSKKIATARTLWSRFQRRRKLCGQLAVN